MIRISILRGVMVAALAIPGFLLTGCQPNTPAEQDANGSQSAQQSADEHQHASDGAHQHGEWWCTPHGVPEEECALCDTSLVADFKQAGDWCEEHNRPDSQCFICNPENFEKFAARYEAKYGERPEMPTE